MNQVNVNQPKISEEGLKELANFFLITVIPRILDEKKYIKRLNQQCSLSK